MTAVKTKFGLMRYPGFADCGMTAEEWALWAVAELGGKHIEAGEKTVTLEYPGIEVAGVPYPRWCELMTAMAKSEANAPKMVALMFLCSVVEDKDAPRQERLQAASLLAEMTK